MFSLTLERGKYLRIRRRVTEKDVTETYGFPASGVFCGAIIALSPPKKYCYAAVGDTYESISRKLGVNEKRLRAQNGNRAVYPTLKIWLP